MADVMTKITLEREQMAKAYLALLPLMDEVEKIDHALDSSTDTRLEVLARDAIIEQRIAEVLEPVWVHLGQFSLLEDVAADRPHALSRVGARLLPLVAQFTYVDEGGAQVCSDLINAIVEMQRSMPYATWVEHVKEAERKLADPRACAQVMDCLTPETTGLADRLNAVGLNLFLGIEAGLTWDHAPVQQSVRG